ncbi:MAG TPA: magnesium transporter [Casimicrobium huifangae]|jgi:magnesium transporter|uniref:magnesium transporter n=1 Tax=Casimicrobium huifangae TaxID=2591109 RepID=UPI0012EC2A40|nr:magnesium transporter [Casimicrobium huifangae]HOB01276.1 magnesium transporter [Casimicrobium huifangae]HQA35090.1 magnesium transporter [Casimicrobium huifangae]HQD64747.1 magnesium transporter [Casimicrobium huifangae]
MPEALEKESPVASSASVDDALSEALADVVLLVRQYRLLSGFAESLADTLDNPSQNPIVQGVLANLRSTLDGLHPADVAHILEALPLDERLFVWDLVKAEREGDILVETSDAVRESLIASMDAPELVAAAATLDTDELAELAPDLPREVVEAVKKSLDPEEREQLRQAMSYEEDMVGALMDFEMVDVRPDVTLEVVMRYLRRFDELPANTDQVFVVDREDKLLGVLPTNVILVTDEDRLVSEVMTEPKIRFEPTDHADSAAAAFERYDLVSAPVVDAHGVLVGRVTVAEVLDFVRESAEEDLRAQAGLREEEDIFASVWKSVQNRWQWLALNLLTAFVASRATDLFQGSIAKLAVLAVLQTIVAGIGGNSGNQTLTMIARAIALGQVGTEHFRRLVNKEMAVAGINGLIFGGAIGLVIGLMEQNLLLGFVLTLAMTLNLLLAAVMGVVIPMWRYRRGQDPAAGSSVLLTAVTDTGGFFIFLGLATLILLR